MAVLELDAERALYRATARRPQHRSDGSVARRRLRDVDFDPRDAHLSELAVAAEFVMRLD